MSNRRRATPRVTLRDVAERAGLTPGAASLALRGDRSIPPATRARVEAAAAALGYVPNAAARALRTQRHNAIGLLLLEPPDGHALATFHEAVAAVGEECMRRGYGVLLLRVPGGAGHTRPGEVQAMIARAALDGAVCIGASTVDWLPQIAEIVASGLPFVFIGRREVDGAPVPHVTTDYAAGSRLVVEHLARLGHRRIAVALDARDRAVPFIHERVAGYRATLEALGLPADPALVLEYDRPDASLPTGRRGPGERLGGSDPTWVPRLRASGATAVYATLFDVARRVLTDLHVARIGVPRDIALVGFGDYPGASALLPPLTVVRQPLAALGAAAVQLLFEQLDGQPAAWPVVLPPALVVRHSCGAARTADDRPAEPDEDVRLPDEAATWR